MCDYATTAAGFGLQRIAAVMLSGTLQTFNVCVECCSRHALPGRIALFREGKDDSRADYIFSKLKVLSGRFANFLQAQGVHPGDRATDLPPRTPKLLITIPGAWRLGTVYRPLSTAFGPKAIEHHVVTADSKVLATDAANRDKLSELTDPPLTVIAGGPERQGIRRGDSSFWAELERYPAGFEPVPRSGENLFLMVFIFGTTDLAKPVPAPPKAILTFVGYLREAVDLHPEDTFWNLTDPGWAYGLYYTAADPLIMDHPTTFHEGPFSVESTCRIICDYGITNLVGSSTAYRLLMAVGVATETALKGRLRAISSADEPLTLEVIRWFADRLGTTIHDHYGQAKLGMVLCNHHALVRSVRVGAIGFACPGYRVVMLDDDSNKLPPGRLGIFALDRRHSPLMWFPGYQGLETAAFVGDYCLSGDTIKLNEDGNISPIGRADDVIITSGYRIGPFDVESALIGHPVVVEAVVIGKPDPERIEPVKVFVVLYAGHRLTPRLVDELQRHVHQRLPAHIYSWEIESLKELPKTPSGKIQCFPLRNQGITRQCEAAPQAVTVN